MFACASSHRGAERFDRSRSFPLTQCHVYTPALSLLQAVIRGYDAATNAFSLSYADGNRLQSLALCR